MDQKMSKNFAFYGANEESSNKNNSSKGNSNQFTGFNDLGQYEVATTTDRLKTINPSSDMYNMSSNLDYNLSTNTNLTNNSLDFNLGELDSNLIDNLIDPSAVNTNSNISNASSHGININIDQYDGDDLNDINNFDGYASPQVLSASLVRDSSSYLSSQVNPQHFSPQSVGISKSLSGSVHNINNNGNSLSKSYGSQLGTSFNNLVSPASTYDGLLDSPYGSYQNGSFNDDFLRSPLNSPSLKAIGSPSSVGSHMNPKNAISKENKLSRRRELHNAVERRRRDLIKEKIKELGLIIPPTMLYEPGKLKSNANKDIRANKSTILSKSVLYITYLKEILDSQDDKLLMLQNRIHELSLEDGSWVHASNSKINSEEQFNKVDSSVDLGNIMNNFDDSGKVDFDVNYQKGKDDRGLGLQSYSDSTSPYEFNLDSPLERSASSPMNKRGGANINNSTTNSKYNSQPPSNIQRPSDLDQLLDIKNDNVVDDVEFLEHLLSKDPNSPSF